MAIELKLSVICHKQKNSVISYFKCKPYFKIILNRKYYSIFTLFNRNAENTLTNPKTKAIKPKLKSLCGVTSNIMRYNPYPNSNDSNALIINIVKKEFLFNTSIIASIISVAAFNMIHIIKAQTI